MKQRLKILLGSLAIAVAGVLAVSMPVAAQSTPEQLACQGSGGRWTGSGCTQGSRTVTGTIKSVGNILIFITSAVSVVMLIVGGLRYALSGGDQGSITGAKNTILYALIGLIVAAAAYAIVNFVLKNI
jgi:hypothetical protein